MFAYCNNNPVNAFDPDGHAIMYISIRDDPTLNMYFGGGGGGGGYAFAGFSSAKDGIKKFEDFITNESEATAQQNLKKRGMSFYKGVPVFMADLAPFDGSAFSFGIIVMDDYYANAQPKDFSDVLNHERGHTTHFSQIGASTYTTTVAIPSLIGAGLTYVSPFIRSNYESLPWENIAEQFGGVNGSYLPSATTIGAIYLGYTILISWIT